jgi:hypothetical protein
MSQNSLGGGNQIQYNLPTTKLETLWVPRIITCISSSHCYSGGMAVYIILVLQQSCRKPVWRKHTLLDFLNV